MRLPKDVVFLGWAWPIAPSYMSPNACGGGQLRGLRLSQWVQLYTGAQNLWLPQNCHLLYRWFRIRIWTKYHATLLGIPFSNIRIPCAGCVSAWRACATRTKTLCISCTPSSRTSPSPRAASRASRLRMSRPRNNRATVTTNQLLTQSVCVLKWNLPFFWINNDIFNRKRLVGCLFLTLSGSFW